MMALSSKDVGRIRWAIRHNKSGTDRVLQQAVYIIENDEVQWRNIQETIFPTDDFEPKS
jgi:hypothetical protein